MKTLKKIVNEHHGINILIKELETEKKMNRIPNELKVELNETKKALNNKQKNGCCMWNRWIRSQIEQEALINNGINRGKAHGRELNGNACKQLCGDRRDTVFSVIKLICREEGEALHQETSVIEEVIGDIEGVRTSHLLWDSVLSKVAITDRI
jgi:hypothetical protein